MTGDPAPHASQRTGDSQGGADVRFDSEGRPEPPVSSGEMDTLLRFLDFHRATLEWKIRGLGSDELARRHPPSTMTLGGLIKHLAYVEDYWFTWTLLGHPWPEPWASADWKADRDWEWHTADEDTPAELRQLWAAAITRSRSAVGRAVIATGPGRGLDTVAARDGQDEPPSARWILVHMIEEYARHNGHADLLREAIDGQTGE